MRDRAHLTVVLAAEGAQDRAAAFTTPQGAVLVLADGAGGSGGGAAAAEAVIAAVGGALMTGNALEWVALLSRVDRQLPVGETTAVVLRVDGDQIAGASVGDSGALLIDHGPAGQHLDLTANQATKPLLGSRSAGPVAFTARLGRGNSTLLIASDGLLKYARLDAIAEVARDPELAAVPRRLIGLVRLRSGALPDDIAILVARWREA